MSLRYKKLSNLHVIMSPFQGSNYLYILHFYNNITPSVFIVLNAEFRKILKNETKGLTSKNLNFIETRRADITLGKQKHIFLSNPERVINNNLKDF